MSPRTKAQLAEIREKSAQQIIDVALELFAHQGFHRTTVSQIARQAGISKGLIYNYFASKEDLLKTIIDQAMQTGDPVLHLMEVAERPRQAIEQAIEQVFIMIKSNPTYWKLITALSFQEDIINQYKTRFEEHGQRNLNMMASIFEAMGVDHPRMEAMYFAATLDGILLHYINFQEHYPIEEMEVFLKSKLPASNKG